jgi:hypothetical protein
MKPNLTLRTGALLLIAAGYGWAGGHFIPEGSPTAAYLFQGCMILVLLTCSAGYLGSVVRSTDPRGARRWMIALTVYTALTLLINVANVIQGAVSHGTNAYGSHNTVADLIPIGMIVGGDIVWLLGLRRRNAG